MIELIIDGECVPQARVRKGQYGNMYDTEKSRDYKQYVGYSAAQQMKYINPFKCAVKFTLHVYRSIPKSWSKKKQKLAINGDVLPTSRPDLDNYIKGVKDALKGIVWLDDSQVVEYGECYKRYAEKPYIYIRVEGIG